MQQYKDLLLNILRNGENYKNRTGIDTLAIPSAMLQFDLRKGFPAITTKKLAFNQVKGELIGFLRGSRSLAEFKSLGCDVWDANVSAWLDNNNCQSEDDMGRIYGTQWRDWPDRSYAVNENCDLIMSRTSIDQLAVALDQLRNNPQSRRILVNAWNPAELDEACLPPCHVLFKLMPNPQTRVLHLSYYQRSCDTFLGVPFNIASYAILLELFAAWSGYTAGILTAHMDDVHLYVNHLPQVEEQLQREPLPLPEIIIRQPKSCNLMSINDLAGMLLPSDISLINYKSHPPIKGDMAV